MTRRHYVCDHGDLEARQPRDQSMTTGQTQHVAIFAAVGALLGFGIGFIADRRR